MTLMNLFQFQKTGVRSIRAVRKRPAGRDCSTGIYRSLRRKESVSWEVCVFFRVGEMRSRSLLFLRFTGLAPTCLIAYW